MKKGFTLLEIMIVMALIAILIMIVRPVYVTSVIRAREAVLKENLYQIRDAISKYYTDKHKYPVALEDLVTEKYLAKMPVDPITSSDDWEAVYFEPEEMEDFDPELMEGIIDVKTKNDGTALDGTLYADW